MYNFCNPGAISHNEILDMYKKYIDPTYTYTNFTLDEQAAILKAGRSNNTLDHTKLCSALSGWSFYMTHSVDMILTLYHTIIYYHWTPLSDVPIDEIHVAMEKLFVRMRKNLEADGTIPNNLPKRASK